MKKIMAVLLSLVLVCGLCMSSAFALDEATPVTLHLFGPGFFTEVGQNGSVDLMSGIERPGYQVIIDRWAELHPNVELVIDAQPWDNWQAAIQSAVLGGDVDIILHGASLCDLVEPLDDYIAAEPGLMDKIFNVAARRTDAVNDLSVQTVTGIPYQVNPMIAYVDKDILAHYGVEIPDATWTWEDALAIAQKTTGTDPVTGEQTYGMQLIDANSVSNRFFNCQLTLSAYDAKAITYGATPAESTINFKTDKVYKAFQMVADLAECCSPDVREGINVDKTLTAENNVALRFDQSCFLHATEAKLAGCEDRFQIMTVPVIEEGEYAGKPSLFMGDNNMAICKTSKNKEWAWEFLKFMVTDEVATQWLVNGMQLPNNRDGMAAVSKALNAEAAAAVDYALANNPYGFNNSTNDYFNNVSFGSMTADMGNAIGEMMIGNMTAEQAVDYVQSKVDEYMASITK